MSKKIEIFGNNIIIPFGRKNTCRTLNDTNPDNYNWKKTDISFSGTFQYFEVYYSQDHPDYDIHSSQSSGGGCVVCFQTGDVRFSEHIVTHSKLFKITVSFGSVNSLISLPGLMSHASIPADVKAAREFPADLVRISVGIEDVNDLIADLSTTMASFKRE